MEIILSITPLSTILVGNQGILPLIAHGRRCKKIVRKKTQYHKSMAGGGAAAREKKNAEE
jgi:hypothetical protein